MLFVCLEIAGGKMVVILYIAHCLSGGWKLSPQGKGLSTQEKSWVEKTSVTPSGHHVIPAGLSLYHSEWAEKVSSSPQIGSPRCVRVETKLVGVLINGLRC